MAGPVKIVLVPTGYISVLYVLACEKETVQIEREREREREGRMESRGG